MEKLLLIAIPDTDGVEQVARRLRLRTVLVQPEQYARSLGQLAGYPAAAAEETPALPLPETGLLVMCGLKNSHMDKSAPCHFLHPAVFLRFGQALDRLVTVSSMCCHTSTSALSTL